MQENIKVLERDIDLKRKEYEESKLLFAETENELRRLKEINISEKKNYEKRLAGQREEFEFELNILQKEKKKLSENVELKIN